jgi:Na+-translocating ferredoxin:NAD+ oxidoreductase RnfD subunit
MQAKWLQKAASGSFEARPRSPRFLRERSNADARQLALFRPGAEAQTAGLASARWRREPRDFQIAALLLLLGYGLCQLGFDVPLSRAIAILTTALLAQFVCCRLAGGKRLAFEPRSALISGLSLCLLLRTNSLPLAAAAAAITSKFLVRWNGKHIFNPTNFALVLMLLWGRGAVWVSPGQWGNIAFFAFAVVCLGGLVVNRAARADVTLAFVGFYLALLFGRSFWLGEPMSIPWHRVQNGALLIFAFFMISDPKTTPNSRAGRLLFALMVALGAAYVQFKLFRTNGLLWSLAACSLSVPLMDRLLPGPKYQWGIAALSRNQRNQRSSRRESALISPPFCCQQKLEPALVGCRTSSYEDKVLYVGHPSGHPLNSVSNTQP